MEIGQREGQSVRTELRRHDGGVEFVVTTDVPRYQDALVHMGWSAAGSGTFARRLASAPQVDRIFERFTHSIVPMILQNLRLATVSWEEALAEFVHRVSTHRFHWWLYGSAALAVRGIPSDPGDLDIAVDDPHLIGDLLSDLLVEPVTHHHAWVAEWTGRAFHGAIIEWTSAGRPTGGARPNEFEPAISEHLQIVTWQGQSLLVPPLELQLAVAESRRQSDRCALIRQAML